ncbi:hypothetical protein [Pseudolactococcus insecticola]|uniref:Uncharacterized protein n=1 Tax=Pseudolactococcus insecticola TaxID=2709158 RepID=A0A6A0BAM1_9LACT|nr:hypothetical protein [Lactococcus insecticola]GFH41434.1 hypothetical protein Hs20B_18320 [Lactococcus insecticola]
MTQDEQQTTIKREIEELYSFNDSLITGDPDYIPRFTDGTPIRPQDVASMNMRALENIAGLIGFVLDD